LGLAGAYGLLFAVLESEKLVNARPTAVNQDIPMTAEPYEVAAIVCEKVLSLESRLLLKGKRRILTICNTGTLATGGIGSLPVRNQTCPSGGKVICVGTS